MLEKEQLQEFVKAVERNDSFSSQQANDILDLFESHECWTPFFQFLKTRTENDATRSMHDYVRMAKAQYVYLEEYNAVADTCVKAITKLKLTYHSFKQEMLARIIEQDDWWCEAIILRAAFNIFSSEKERILCLERLCLIYEKKIFNESELNKAYNLLKTIDPKNIKALRYFKVVYTQNHEWDSVVETLESLIAVSSHPQDIFRYAQELAAINLYQLDRPKEVIAILDKYCASSPLDTSTIHFDAYQRIGDWEGCVKVLIKCLNTVDEETHKAILAFKIGQLQEKINKTEDAIKHYQKSFELWPKFLEPLESLIGLHVQNKNWKEVSFWAGETW
jgi:tetratricopeptide (TPR) repeat protein